MVNWRNKVISEGTDFVFSSSFVGMIVERRNPSKLLFETMILEKDLPPQGHPAVPRNG